ncbi:trissin receptor-like [Macrobrachium nipponense]|uniref:trissin receptor-like n=1 Tax=Macrobrachium nipponense TaxID=159736 RepID=UPI0030C817E8
MTAKMFPPNHSFVGAADDLPPRSAVTAIPVNTSSAAVNETDQGDAVDILLFDEDSEGYYLFHRLEVKVPLLVIYTLVFIFAFFGNLLVVLVMVFHRRMRSHTNFFLTNLAVADLCVAVFCIYQNFAMYVIKDWYFGEFLCLMYHFINQLSYTASVIILVVVSAERYLAIVEPLKAKTILTRTNMIITMVLVWIISAVYSCPRLLYFKVHEYPVEGGRTEAMCILRRDLFDTRVWDVISLVLLYLLPLLLLSVLYARIAHTLWRSGRMLTAAASPYTSSAAVAVVSTAAEYGTFKTQHTASMTSTSSSGGGGNDVIDMPRNHGRNHTTHINRGSVKSTLSTYVSMGSMRDDGLRVNHFNSDAIPLTPLGHSRCLGVVESSSLGPTRSPRAGRTSPRIARSPMQLHPSPLVLRARRNVIKMLIMVVLSFAGCSLPFHARKMLQYYWSNYNHNSTASYIMTPITFLLMYANSAVNPILYTFMSRKFRTSSRDLLTCRVWQARRHRQPPPPTVVARLSGRDKVITHLL